MKKRTAFDICHTTALSAHGAALSRLSAVLLAALVAGSLSGCGGGSFSATRKSVAMETTAAAMEMDSYEAAAYDTAAGMPAPGGAPGSSSGFSPEAAPEQGTLTASGTIQPTVTSRKLIRNVDLHVETTEFDTLISSISKTVTDLGGYLESSDISGTSISGSYEYEQRRYASLTARIPSDKLDGFIAQVDTQGNITSRSESTQDVTLQYSDVESRKKSLTIEQERLWALLEKADSVDAVIALESRLSEIRYQLESLESQLRTYDNQVDYSTVRLSVDEVKVFTPTSPDSVFTRMQKGFQKSLANVGEGLLNFSVWFVTILPVLFVLAVIALILLLIAKQILAHSVRKAQKNSEQKAQKASKQSTQKTSKQDPQKPREQDTQKISEQDAP